MLGIKRKISMALAAVMLIVSVGAVQVSSAAGTKSRQYIVYDFATQQEVTSAAYTLTLSEQYGTSTYGIIGSDDRVQYDNSGIVYLTAGSGHGTGFIVGDHTIATAAHCIYNLNSSKYYSDLKITLYDNDGNVTKTLTKNNNTHQAHIPVWYKNPPVSGEHYKYDYALITVTEDLSSYEHFKLGELINSAAHSTNIPVNVAGFPGEYSPPALYIGTGNLLETYENHFEYNTDTTPGQSGGPVFVNSTYTVVKNNAASSVSLKTVIGINAYEGGTFNFATKITPELRYFYLNNPYNDYEE